MDENKQILTLKDLSENKTLTKGCAMVFSPIILILIIWIICNGDYEKLTFPLTIITIMVIKITKEKKERKIINNKNFKIIEDQIYDKTTMHVSKHEEYYFYTKIHGKIEVSYIDYPCAKKNSFIYLIVSNKNNKIIDTYLADKYELSPELISKFIPYNESLGESNFNKRIKDSINEFKEKKKRVICKNCGTKYNLKKENACPNCNTPYKINITDVVCQKNWYQ